MSEVVLENVSKTYAREVVAVRDANLVIHDQELLVLVGPSGCGKSTTLRMIAGLEEISRGRVLIGGKEVNHVPPKDRDIAMVFQNYALYPHMNVYKNMAFGLRLRRFPKAEIDQRVREAAEILGIQDLLHRRPKELSGGQRQRVAVGRAIVRKPKVFLFDEPLSNLDAKLRVQMRTEISKLHHRLAATMIYVTHDQTEAMTLGDRIVVMNGGVIQQVASPLELYQRPANRVVAGFIGSPPMNCFEGRLDASADGLTFRSASFSVLLDPAQSEALGVHAGRDVVFGLRAEDIRDARSVPDSLPAHRVPATLEVVEPVGAEAYLYLRTDSLSFTARVDARTDLVVDQAVELAFDMKQAHFFDAQSGVSLGAA
jgi:multiple sugar transport system ATP-binding protein